MIETIMINLQDIAPATPPGTRFTAPRTPAVVPQAAVASPPSAWSAPGWQRTGFSLSRPDWFSYEIEDDGSEVRVGAIGDQDADGTPSTFEVRASRGTDGNLTFVEVTRDQPFE